MALIDDLAERLAARALDLAEAHGDDDLPLRVGQAIGAASPTLQEAYNTAVRLMRGARIADRMMDGLDMPPVGDAD